MIYYIKHGINYVELTDLLSNASENIWIQVNRPKTKPLVISAFYRPRDELVDSFLDGLNKLLS